jgi:hypothetical protein
MRSHQFGVRDLVQDITPDVLNQPLPNIADARTLKELREDVVRGRLFTRRMRAIRAAINCSWMESPLPQKTRLPQ